MQAGCKYCKWQEKIRRKYEKSGIIFTEYCLLITDFRRKNAQK